MVDRPHQLQAELGQIVVGRDQVRAAAGERVQVERQRGDQGLAFAGFHFGDGAAVEHHAAQQLHVVVAQAGGAFARLAHRGESFRQHFPEDVLLRLLERLFDAVDFEAGEFLFVGAQHLQVFLLRLLQFGAQIGRRRLDALLKGDGHPAQRVVALALELRLQFADAGDDRPELLEDFLIWVAGDGVVEAFDHNGRFSVWPSVAASPERTAAALLRMRSRKPPFYHAPRRGDSQAGHKVREAAATLQQKWVLNGEKGAHAKAERALTQRRKGAKGAHAKAEREITQRRKGRSRKGAKGAHAKAEREITQRRKDLPSLRLCVFA